MVATPPAPDDAHQHGRTGIGDADHVSADVRIGEECRN
jgi:hypothetical protein